MTRQWSLFVDETGPIHDPASAASLVGVLAEGEPFEIARELRHRIERAMPEGAYPPHAVELRRTWGVIRWLLRAGRPHPLLDLARAHLAAADLEAISDDRRPPDEVSSRITRAVEGTPLASQASALARRAKEALRRELGAFSEAREVLWLTGSVDAHDPRGPGSPVAGGARYDAALRGLFERTLLLLRSPARERHVIRVVAARIDRREPALGLALRPLMPRDIGRAADEAQALPFHRVPASATPQVRFVPEVPPRYDANVHPGVVVADFVANELHAPLGQAGSLRRLLDHGFARTRLRGETTPRGLDVGVMPTPSAVGAEEVLWRAALEAAPRPDLSPRFPRWRYEQADRWAAALEGVEA